MKRLKGKYYKFYYFDETNDDFANNNIAKKPLPEKWNYYSKNPFYVVFKAVMYYFALFFLTILIKCFFRTKLKNKKVIKNRADKKKGFFIFGNHTGWVTDATAGHMACFPKQTYILTSADVVNIKGIRWFVKCLGATPVPEGVKNYMTFIKSVKEMTDDGHPIVIYPEEHIWPRYNKIRDFGTKSFHFPCKLNLPAYAKTTVFTLNKKGKARSTIYFDGPFYPDMSLPLKEREQALRDQIYNTMVSRVDKSELDTRYEYIKVDSPDKVRTEVF